MYLGNVAGVFNEFPSIQLLQINSITCSLLKLNIESILFLLKNADQQYILNIVDCVFLMLL
jgi:hypothetical protein